MKAFNFSIPVRIQFGEGVTGQLGALVKSLPVRAGSLSIRKALVVQDPGISQATWLKDILGSLEIAGIQISIFDQVQPNPKDEDVNKAAGLLKSMGAECVIGIGGGSTLDTAKTAALIAGYGKTIGEYAGWGKVPGPLLPVIAIPTTSGSGSEATSWAVITDSQTHAKLAIGDPNLTPYAALVDPGLTLTLPPGLTAATGMDVLTHCIEAYVCALSSAPNDMLALEGIRLVAQNLAQVTANGNDLERRGAMAYASTLGGIAINNADVAGVHCLSEGMGSIYDAPHGLLNAILLPYLMEFWLPGCRERFIQIAEAFGRRPEPEEAVNGVAELNKSLNLPGLTKIGVRNEDLPRLAELAEANVSNPSNPVSMNARDYQKILARALTGKPV